MKKLLFTSLLLASFAAQAQTSVFKIEVDTAIINKIYVCNAFDISLPEKEEVKNFQEKEEFVNNMLIDFLKSKATECVGNEAADKARKIAVAEIETKPITKGK